MQSDAPSTASSTANGADPLPAPPSPSIVATAPGQLRVIKRNGTVVTYDDDKIQVALTKAFLAVEGGTAAASSRIRELVAMLTDQVSGTFRRRLPSGGTIHIEEIQDQVELALMRSGEHKVARDYVLYREERARIRAANAAEEATEPAVDAGFHVVAPDGSRLPLDVARIRTLVMEACEGLTDVDPERIIDEALANMYDGIAAEDVATSLLITARTLVEEEPNYTYVTARLLLDQLRTEALTFLGVDADTRGGVAQATQTEMAEIYGRALAAFIDRGVELELLAPELKRFDVKHLGQALKPERDLQFTYLGLQTLYDRYFIHSNDTRFELPQVFFMRVAMGLAIQEDDPEARAIEFYDLLSSFDYMSSTPTLFNAGTMRSQLSSCFLTTVSDDLDGIYSAIRDNALLSKWAGGLGNDWTPVRALGSYIKGTNGKSQGVVPFLKVVNDTAVAVNQCFAPDTRVHTADGVKPMREVTTDDLVLGQRGKYRQVPRHHDLQPDRPHGRSPRQAQRQAAPRHGGPSVLGDPRCAHGTKHPPDPGLARQGQGQTRVGGSRPARHRRLRGAGDPQGGRSGRRIQRRRCPLVRHSARRRPLFRGRVGVGRLRQPAAGRPSRLRDLLPGDPRRSLLGHRSRRTLSTNPLGHRCRPGPRRHHRAVPQCGAARARVLTRGSLRREWPEAHRPPVQPFASLTDARPAAGAARNRRRCQPRKGNLLHEHLGSVGRRRPLPDAALGRATAGQYRSVIRTTKPPATMARRRASRESSRLTTSAFPAVPELATPVGLQAVDQAQLAGRQELGVQPRSPRQALGTCAVRGRPQGGGRRVLHDDQRSGP